MPSFESDGVEIQFDDVGAGDPIVLIHGWGSSAQHNFGDTGISGDVGLISMLARRFRVIAMDCRGHGRSAKPHRQELHGKYIYGRPQMAADVVGLLDHLELARASVVGYSMGSSIALELMLKHPDRLRAAVLGGIAYDDGIEVPALREAIAQALLAPSGDGIKDPVAGLPPLRRIDRQRSVRAGGNNFRPARVYRSESAGTDPHADSDRGRYQGYGDRSA